MAKRTADVAAEARARAAKLFKGVEDVKGKRSANYIRPGGYYVRINAVRMDTSRKDEMFVAVEMTVLGVLFTENDDDGVAISNKVGEDVSHLMMSKFDMFLPNIKSMVSSLTGCPEAEVDLDTCVDMVLDDQPLACYVAEVHARGTVTKANRDFTDVTYKGIVSAADFTARGFEAPEDSLFSDSL